MWFSVNRASMISLAKKVAKKPAAKIAKRSANIVKPKLKETYDLITHYQNNPELFKKYKESIDLIKNKSFYEMYEKTSCLSTDNDSDYISECESNYISDYISDCESDKQSIYEII